MNEKFETIDIEVTEEIKSQLCETFMKKVLSPASWSVYEDTKQQTGDVKQAMYFSIINQQIIDILEEQIHDNKTKNEKEVDQ